jgi:hypothetical protein
LFPLAADRAARKTTENFREAKYMKSEEVKELTTKTIEDLGAALSAGHTEELTHYLQAMGRFHRYSLLCLPQHRNENANWRTMLIGKRNRK